MNAMIQLRTYAVLNTFMNVHLITCNRWHCAIFIGSLSMHSTILHMLNEPGLFNRVC